VDGSAASDAFLWESAPGYLPRDRDRTFGDRFVAHVKAMGIKQVLSARGLRSSVRTSNG
jgi:hypothetical protein